MFDHRDTVHEHVLHAFRKLIRILKRGQVTEACGIEYDDVSPHSLFQDAAIDQAHTLRGECAEFTDGIFESQQLIFTGVFAQDAREGSIGARVRMLPSQNPIGRRTLRVVVD